MIFRGPIVRTQPAYLWDQLLQVLFQQAARQQRLEEHIKRCTTVCVSRGSHRPDEGKDEDALKPAEVSGCRTCRCQARSE